VDINPPGAVSAKKPYSRFNIVDVLISTLDILNGRLTRRVLLEDPPDVLVSPEVGGVLALDFRHAERLVEIGRRAVDEAMSGNRGHDFGFMV
jgi:hypothetical protein